MPVVFVECRRPGAVQSCILIGQIRGRGLLQFIVYKECNCPGQTELILRRYFYLFLYGEEELLFLMNNKLDHDKAYSEGLINAFICIA